MCYKNGLVMDHEEAAMANVSGGKAHRKRDPAIIAAWIAGGLALVGVFVGVLLPRMLGGNSTAQPSPSGAESTSLTPTSSPDGQPQACSDFAGTAPGVTSLAFSKDGAYLVGGDSNGRIYLWDVATQQTAAQFQDPATQGIRAVAFNPDGQFAALDANGHIYTYGHSLAATFTAPGVTSLAFSKDGAYLVGGDSNGRIYLWDVATQQTAAQFQDPATQGIRAVAFNPDGQFAALDANGHIYTYGHSLAATFTAPGVTSLAFSKDGAYLVGGDSNGRIYLWDVATQQTAAQFQDPATQGIRAVAFNPDGQFAALDANGHIYTYGHSLAATFTAPGVTSLAFSKDGAYLVGGDSNGRIYLWDVATQQTAAQFQDPATQGIRAVAFNPDGQFAALDANGHIYTYGHSLAATFTAPGVTSLAFSKDGAYLVGGDSNGRIYLWDVATQQTAAQFQDPATQGIRAVAFNPD